MTSLLARVKDVKAVNILEFHDQLLLRLMLVLQYKANVTEAS